MSKIICINFASRNRPDKFYECLENIREHFENRVDYFIYAKIGVDQVDLYNVNRLRNEYPEVIPNIGASTGKIGDINRGVTAIPNDYDIICNHSDDMFFTKYGADTIIKEHCGEDDFVHFPDGYQGSNLCTYSVMGREYFERFGYIYHPSYKSLWCDNEAQDVAKKLGRYKFVNENILIHKHPQNEGKRLDAQYQLTESFYRIDKANYDKRKANGFL